MTARRFSTFYHENFYFLTKFYPVLSNFLANLVILLLANVKNLSYFLNPSAFNLQIRFSNQFVRNAGEVPLKLTSLKLS